ncbi:COX15/CtaA family protein [Ferrimicrobium acidiphilum]|uniref:COX15/CtaA family protein n=2 Tax=Ferrimicrobium acidiphilum TaxID=121039 RepID=UPI0023F3376A|nr:COX15/CtaA family protein [Ferrimicrobium acidiphilum]
MNDSGGDFDMGYVSGAPPRSDSPKLLRWISLLALIATYCLIVLGSTVRVTHSGMGCRSWPLCNGHIAPLDNFHSAIEQYHRYGAAIVSVLVFYTGFLAWRHCRRLPRVFVPALLSCGVILLQVALGALTVLTHNAPITVGMHLVTGLIELAIVTVVAVTTRSGSSLPTERVALQTGLTKQNVLRWGLVAVMSTLAIIITGSVVVNTHASKSCPQWPFCAGPLHLVAAQYLHRGVVLVGVVLIGLALHRAWGKWRGLGVGAIIVIDAVILAIQIVIGAFSAILRAPAYIQDLHLATAALFWVGIITFATMAWDRMSFHEEQLQSQLDQQVR